MHCGIHPALVFYNEAMHSKVCVVYMQTPLPYYDNSPLLHEESYTCPFTLSYAEHMLP